MKASRHPFGLPWVPRERHSSPRAACISPGHVPFFSITDKETYSVHARRNLRTRKTLDGDTHVINKTKRILREYATRRLNRKNWARVKTWTPYSRGCHLCVLPDDDSWKAKPLNIVHFKMVKSRDELFEDYALMSYVLTLSSWTLGVISAVFLGEFKQDIW